jgi:hypothetical protein
MLEPTTLSGKTSSNVVITARITLSVSRAPFESVNCTEIFIAKNTRVEIVR